MTVHEARLISCTRLSRFSVWGDWGASQSNDSQHGQLSYKRGGQRWRETRCKCCQALLVTSPAKPSHQNIYRTVRSWTSRAEESLDSWIITAWINVFWASDSSCSFSMMLLNVALWSIEKSAEQSTKAGHAMLQCDTQQAEQQLNK